jgi:predicted negative regulator of RcsB-dependent stress response
MFRYKLRTPLILLAILPPLMWVGWTKYEAWKAEQARRAAQAEREKIFNFYFGATR